MYRTDTSRLSLHPEQSPEAARKAARKTAIATLHAQHHERREALSQPLHGGHLFASTMRDVTAKELVIHRKRLFHGGSDGRLARPLTSPREWFDEVYRLSPLHMDAALAQVLPVHLCVCVRAC
jgi:hypothetical protein